MLLSDVRLVSSEDLASPAALLMSRAALNETSETEMFRGPRPCNPEYSPVTMTLGRAKPPLYDFEC